MSTAILTKLKNDVPTQLDVYVPVLIMKLETGFSFGYMHRVKLLEYKLSLTSCTCPTFVSPDMSNPSGLAKVGGVKLGS